MSDQHHNETDIEEIGTAPNEAIADLWRQVLHDEGIIALLKPTGLGHAFVPNALNPHIVYVRVDQAERAREIIASLSDEEDAGDSSESSS